MLDLAGLPPRHGTLPGPPVPGKNLVLGGLQSGRDGLPLPAGSASAHPLEGMAGDDKGAAGARLCCAVH